MTDTVVSEAQTQPKCLSTCSLIHLLLLLLLLLLSLRGRLRGCRLRYQEGLLDIKVENTVPLLGTEELIEKLIIEPPKTRPVTPFVIIIDALETFTGADGRNKMAQFMSTVYACHRHIHAPRPPPHASRPTPPCTTRDWSGLLWEGRDR